ncbi:MAG: hypothetical protein IKS03_05390 [Ruminococcus sp.]|nr:hypothetical protein [Ruminococcus sp.]
MKMKKIIAALAASAVSLTALASVSLSGFAAETDINYTGPSTGAYKNENNNLRVNIWNTWGNDIKDLDTNAYNCSEWVKVDFTITGLGNQLTNKNTDGTNSDSYYAFLGGSIGANAQRFTKEDAESVGDSVVDITGDGSYTATFNLAEAADTILCLYLETNINPFNREGFANDDPSTTGINIKIDRVYTVAPEESAETTTTDASAVTTTTDASADNAATTTTTTTSKDSSSKSSSSSSSKSGSSTTTEKSAQTGDAGVGAAVAAVSVAAAAAFVARKKD